MLALISASSNAKARPSAAESSSAAKASSRRSASDHSRLWRRDRNHRSHDAALGDERRRKGVRQRVCLAQSGGEQFGDLLRLVPSGPTCPAEDLGTTTPRLGPRAAGARWIEHARGKDRARRWHQRAARNECCFDDSVNGAQPRHDDVVGIRPAPQLVDDRVHDGVRRGQPRHPLEDPRLAGLTLDLAIGETAAQGVPGN